MSDFIKFLIKAYLRKGLAILGTYLLTHGILTEQEAHGFAGTYLEPLVGAVLVGASALWTWAYQYYVKRKVQAALMLPQGTSTKKLEEVISA